MLCHKIENHFRSFFVAMLRTEFCFMSVDPESQIVSLFCNAFYRLLTVLKLREEGHTHMLVLREVGCPIEARGRGDYFLKKANLGTSPFRMQV